MRAVGGPLDGADLDGSADVVIVQSYPDHAYHRTRPTDTDWRMSIDPDWWMKGLPEPVRPDRVYEWHERDWLPPEVRLIRDAVREASAR